MNERNQIVLDLVRKADQDVCRVLSMTLGLLEGDQAAKASVLLRVLTTQLAGLTAVHNITDERRESALRDRDVSAAMTKEEILYCALFVYAVACKIVFGGSSGNGLEEDREARDAFEKVTGYAPAGRWFVS